MSDPEFIELLAQLDAIFARALDAFVEAAPLLASLSRVQLKKVKQRYRGAISSEHIERLVEFGNGKMPQYLAKSERWIKVSTWRRMTPVVKATLSDENKLVDVYRPSDKPRERALKDLTPVEWNMVLDEKKGLRPVAEQRQYMIERVKNTDQDLFKHASLFKSLVPHEKKGFVVLVSDDGTLMLVEIIKLKKAVASLTA